MSAQARKPAVSITNEGAVAVLRLDRPERLNTIDDELGADLLTCLRRAAADAGTRAVLLTRVGRSFMAGADLTLFKSDLEAAPQTAGRLIDLLHESQRLMRGTPKPVIAAVQGPVAGGGLGLALACDLVVAADDAVFVSAYTRIGTSPDAGTTWSLTHLLGARRALQMMLLNDPVDAATALSWGLVNIVVPRAELDASALALAVRLAGGASGAMAAVKRLVGEAADTSFVAQLDREKASFMTEAAKPDFREGVSAFLERRKPIFL